MAKVGASAGEFVPLKPLGRTANFRAVRLFANPNNKLTLGEVNFTLRQKKSYGREHSKCPRWGGAAKEGNRQGPAQERDRPDQFAAQAIRSANN
jgi:hypothetical protein